MMANATAESQAETESSLQLELRPYMALPMQAKTRMPPTTGKKLYTGAEVLQALTDILGRQPPLPLQTALLKLTQDYTIGPKALTIVINTAKVIWKVTYAELVPFFNIPAVHPYQTIPLYRCRLPLESIRLTVESVDHATLRYGPLSMHRNEVARSRYIAALFRVILEIFQGSILNRPERPIDGELIGKVNVEHIFRAFYRTVIIFVDVKWTLPTTTLDQGVAQLIAECDARDLSNASRGLWCPILGVLSDGVSMQLFVYDSSTREVQASKPVEMLSTSGIGSELLKSIRRCTEMFYDFFLIGYMNGLHSFLHESEKWVHMSGRRIVSTNRWKTSLERARSGLAKGREGTELMLAGKYDEAEEMALASLEDVKQSVRLAPAHFNWMQPALAAWMMAG